MLDEMINFIHSVPAVFEVIANFVADAAFPVLLVDEELPEAVDNWILNWATGKTFADAEDGLNQLWERVHVSNKQGETT